MFNIQGLVNSSAPDIGRSAVHHCKVKLFVNISHAHMSCMGRQILLQRHWYMKQPLERKKQCSIRNQTPDPAFIKKKIAGMA